MLKRIGQFIVENAFRLGSQLSTFEQNVATETADIRASFQPALAPISFTSTSSVAAGVTLVPGQLALCDSSIGNVSVTLAASSGLVPGWLAIVKRSALNTVTVSPSGMTKLGAARRINATTSKAYAAVGIGWIYFDGTEWWA